MDCQTDIVTSLWNSLTELSELKEDKNSEALSKTATTSVVKKAQAVWGSNLMTLCTTPFTKLAFLRRLINTDTVNFTPNSSSTSSSSSSSTSTQDDVSFTQVEHETFLDCCRKDKYFLFPIFSEFLQKLDDYVHVSQKLPSSAAELGSLKKSEREEKINADWENVLQSIISVVSEFAKEQQQVLHQKYQQQQIYQQECTRVSTLPLKNEPKYFVWQFLPILAQNLARVAVQDRFHGETFQKLVSLCLNQCCADLDNILETLKSTRTHLQNFTEFHLSEPEKAREAEAALANTLTTCDHALRVFKYATVFGTLTTTLCLGLSSVPLADFVPFSSAHESQMLHVLTKLCTTADEVENVLETYTAKILEHDKKVKEAAKVPATPAAPAQKPATPSPSLTDSSSEIRYDLFGSVRYLFQGIFFLIV